MDDLKLTGLQRQTLAEAANGSIEQKRFGHGAWRITGGSPTVVGRLVARGLLRWDRIDGDTMSCMTTVEGAAALARQ